MNSNKLILSTFLCFTVLSHALNHEIPVSETVFAAVDIETTGFNHKHDRIIELSIITFQNTNVLNKTSWLIDPERPIPHSSSKVHNITDDMVKGMPNFNAVADEILTALSNSVIIAHNARFDWNFIKAEFKKADKQEPPLTVIDSIPLTKSVFTNQQSYALGNLISNLNLNAASPTHRAEDDAMALFFLFQRCIQEIGPSQKAAILKPFAINK